MEDNVGTIVIATKVDNKGLEKGLNKAEQTIKSKEKKVKISYESETASVADERWHDYKTGTEKEYAKWVEEQNKNIKEQVVSEKQITQELEAQESLSRTSTEDLKGKIDFLSQQKDLSPFQTEQLEKYKTQLEEIKNIQSQNGIEYDFTGGYTAQIEELQWKLNELMADYNALASEPGFNEQSREARELEIEIEKVNNQLDRMKEKQSKMNSKGIVDMEKGFSRIGKKIFRIGLALVGVRTVINLITRSFNTLAQYNEELGTKMEQMRLVLAVALEPIINWIVNMLQVILSLINQIMSSLFGINLFGRASELWTEKMKKNMASGASSARDMRKQLAGFDEMNVLNDNVAGSGGGGGGASMEPWDLEEKPIPGWMEWILKNGSLIAGIITGIAVALFLLKFNLDPLLSLGIGVLIAGIVMLIMDIIDYLKDPTWEKFGNIIRDIGVILIGLGIIIGNIPLIVIGAIVLIVGLVIKYWEQIKGFILGIADWFHQKGEDFKKNGNKFLGGIFDLISKTIEDVVWLFEWLVNVAKTIFDGIIDFLKKGFTEGWGSAWESLRDTFGKIWDKIKEIGAKTWERLKENTKIFIDAVKDLFNKMVNWLAQKMADIYNKIMGTINGILNFIISAYNTVINYFKGIGIAIGDFFSGAIKGAVNGVLSWVESKVNWFIDKINSVISLINKIPGVSIGRMSRISLPRMAVGGIINQPGRGVPVGGAIAGEAGREGILPLTDRQAMAELGREIGKWISIQATVPVNIGNRQVARVIQELNNDREFAMNS